MDERARRIIGRMGRESLGIASLVDRAEEISTIELCFYEPVIIMSTLTGTLILLWIGLSCRA